MHLTLMYITNNPITAQIAQTSGVDRIWVDLEYIGKDSRQAGLDTVKSHHTINDIIKIKNIIKTSKLLVRINPIHNPSIDYCGSEKEINDVVLAGADIIMLPMFKTCEEIQQFVTYVGGRCKTQLLLETSEAVEILDDILKLEGIDEIHIGLNDLHLAYKKTFMFELLCDGTVENICKKISKTNIKYGFGGIARVSHGLLPAEYIIAEHFRLRSTAAILSRGFCDANTVKNPIEIESLFLEGVKNIRLKEQEILRYSPNQLLQNLEVIKTKVNIIVESIKKRFQS